MNTLGLVICLIGISIHCVIKAKEKADSLGGMKIYEIYLIKKKSFFIRLFKIS